MTKKLGNVCSSGDSKMWSCSFRSVIMSVAAGLAVFYILGLFLEESRSSSSQIDWKATFFDADPLREIPESDLEEAKSRIQQKHQDILGTQMFYRECFPKSWDDSGKTILLLHGAAFKSETWVKDVPTIQTMCALGHRVVAVDLPGHGETKDCNNVQCKEKGKYLKEIVVKVTGEVKPVIVSPSFSGTYSLPFMANYQELAGGFVPVAPVGTEGYESFFGDSMSVPTLIVYGDKDTTLGRTSAKYLKSISTASQPIILSPARHPAYLDQPEKWHQALHNFVKKIP